MNLYGLGNEQEPSGGGGFFEFNKHMSEIGQSYSIKNDTSEQQLTSTTQNGAVQTAQQPPKAKSSSRSTPESSVASQPDPAENRGSVIVCSSFQNGQQCLVAGCKQCYGPEAITPHHSNRSFGPSIVKSDAIDGERVCGYFKKGFPCPFPACKYKCYDASQRLPPAVAKRRLSPDADSNVKLCDYYKYDRPCPFPRCKYKCYTRPPEIPITRHFPAVNRRHSADRDHRDVDHRASAKQVPPPIRRDSWEAKCDEFIMKQFEIKPNAASPSPNPGNAESTTEESRKRKSQEKAGHEENPSKRKRSHSRDKGEKSSSKKKKSKHHKKEKKSKKSKEKKEKSKDNSSSASKHSKSKHKHTRTERPHNRDERSHGHSPSKNNHKSLKDVVSVEAEAWQPSAAFLDYIVKNFHKKSKKKLPINLELQGIFQCKDEEMARCTTEDAKIEMIGRKTCAFFKDQGYDEDKIYDISTLMDAQTLEKELRGVVFSAVNVGKIGHSKIVINQMFRVIELGMIACKIGAHITNFLCLQ